MRTRPVLTAAFDIALSLRPALHTDGGNVLTALSDSFQISQLSMSVALRLMLDALYANQRKHLLPVRLITTTTRLGAHTLA